jgi:hypothetical protein
VAEDQIFTRREVAFLRELVKAGAPFMVVGLASAALQGAPAVTQDIDLWFRDLTDPRIRKALDKVGGVYVPPVGINPPMFAGEGVEMFDIVLRMDGLRSFDEEMRGAIEVPVGKVRIKLLPLERIIVSKKAANRPKDRLSLPVLQNASLAIHPRHRGQDPSKSTGAGSKGRGRKAGVRKHPKRRTP